MSRRYKPWTGAELRRAAAMRLDGMSYVDIGRALDRHPYGVNRALRQAALHHHVDQLHESKGYLKVVRRALILRNQGWSYPAIVDHLGWHKGHGTSMQSKASALRKALYAYSQREGLPLRRGERR